MDLIYNIKIFLSNMVSLLIIPFFRRKHRIFNDKILIINTEKLGDLILSSDFLYSFGLKNKNTRFYLLLNESFRELFYWPALGYSAITINKNKYRYNPIYRFLFIKNIRNNKYKAVINITQERGMINDELALTSGARVITAMKNRSLYIPSFFLRNNNSKYDEVFTSSTSSEYHRLKEYLVREKIDLVSGGKIFYSLTAFREVKIEPGCIIIAPMASEMEKSWGLSNFRDLCGKIEYNIILLGGKNEFHSLEYIRNGRNNIINNAGLNFSDTSAIISKCRLFIGNDSGITHLAHQIGKPLIAIIGGGKFGKFFPYKERDDAVFLYNKLDCFGCDWKCILDKKYCLTEISVDQVMQSINTLLSINLQNKNI